MAAELKLQISLKNGKSVIEDSYFTSPLKLGVPRQNSERLTIIFMMASAGILKGDELIYDIRCGRGTKALLTDQSYTKIFNTGNGGASKRQYIKVEEGASLYYCPNPVIPFAGSSFEGDTVVKLHEDSEFAYSDIIASGRIGMGEGFKFRRYKNRTCVEIADVPVWLDHCLLCPDTMDLEGMFYFDGYTHQGTFYYYGPEEKQNVLTDWYLNRHISKEIYETSAMPIYGGITRAGRGACLRVLAHTAQDIEELFSEAARVLEL